jgi:hypothetical protein
MRFREGFFAMDIPVRLLLVGLVLVAVPGASSAASKGRPAAANYPTWIVAGYGPTVPDAQTHGFAEASRTIADYLQKHHPALAWAPPESYLRQHGIVRPVGEPQSKDLNLAGPTKEVQLRVTITPELLEDALVMSRQQRMEDRQALLARILAGLAAVLLVVGGYLRLEDATRGYYNRALRLAAAGLLAIVAFGLWLVR